MCASFVTARGPPRRRRVLGRARRTLPLVDRRGREIRHRQISMVEVEHIERRNRVRVAMGERRKVEARLDEAEQARVVGDAV
jgi:hypothetical protein